MADDERNQDADAGAPIGKDAIDPELISLRRPAPRIGAVAAAAVLLLCIVLMVRLRHDFTFARAGEAARPVTVQDAAAGRVATDSYVTFTAPTDSTAAIRARVSTATPGARVRPVVGTNDRLWVAEPGDPWGPARHDQVVTGRLRAMSAVRFGAPVASAMAKGLWPQFVAGAELARARQAAPTGGTLTLVDGGTLTIDGAAEVELWLPDPGRAIVVGTFGTRLNDVATWTEALAKAGVIAAGTPPISKTDTLARWQVQRPDAIATINQQLDAAQLWGARVEPSPVRIRARWSELIATAEGVNVPARAEAPVPWTAIDVAAVWTARKLPAGAYVVITDEKPADYWYLTPLYIGLAVITLLFAWALVMAVRRQFFDDATVAKA